MILVDTGPLIALFDPKDAAHGRCRQALKAIREPLCTTTPVLTEAFHLLSPDSLGSSCLRDFVARRGMSVWFLTEPTLLRAFELMEQYADQAMDLADATLVAAAEALKTRKVFSIGRRDFDRYRLKRGHRYVGFEVLP
ncbi:MAG: type II toxin-antitoxin system VapC family toxin [Gammaproteobacteria bacterium]